MGKNDKEWLAIDLMQAAERHFRDSGIESARLNAEVLLACVLGLTRMELYLKHDRPVFEKELEQFRRLCKERLKGRPLQYLTGEQIFYGRSFLVDHRVLIPRPETELLVEHALERANDSGVLAAEEVRVLDIGTGSGCIAVMLALTIPNAAVTAVDISRDALDVAAGNARRHGVTEKITFRQADALGEGFVDQAGSRYDMVLSNPPYIPVEEWESLQTEVKDHEPRIALTDPGGFAFYRAISGNAASLLKSGGMLFFELHADAAEKVVGIMKNEGLMGIELQQDYAGFSRMVSAIAAEGSRGL